MLNDAARKSIVFKNVVVHGVLHNARDISKPKHDESDAGVAMSLE